MKIEWWTLALQTINVVILLWILQRFLFKPVQAVIAQRQQQAQKLTNEANAARLSAEQERATLANERSMLATERERALSSAQAEAQQAGAALLERPKHRRASIRLPPRLHCNVNAEQLKPRKIGC